MANLSPQLLVGFDRLFVATEPPISAFIDVGRTGARRVEYLIIGISMDYEVVSGAPYQGDSASRDRSRCGAAVIGSAGKRGSSAAW